MYKKVLNRNKLLKLSHKAKSCQEKKIIFKQYKEVWNKIVKLIRQSKENYFNNHFSKNIKSPKNIWKGISDLIQRKDKLQKEIPLKINNNNVTDPNAIANGLNLVLPILPTKFEIVFQDAIKCSIVSCLYEYKIQFSLHQLRIMKYWNWFKEWTTSRWLGHRAFKIKSFNLKFWLIFSTYLSTGKLSTLLKSAKIISVYKNKGDDQIASNYRPIAQLSK